MTVLSPRRLLLAAVVALVALACAAAPASAGLSSQITAILSRHGLAGGSTAVSVWRDGTSSAVYARNTRTLLAPASNEKLLTATSALYRWGADHTFKTELYLPAAPADPTQVGVVQGDVYIKGYGDPSLSTPSFQQNALGIHTASLNDFVKALQTMHVTEITGHVVADDSVFDDQDAPGSWTPGVRDECGRLSALVVNEGQKGDDRVLDPAKYTARLLTTRLREAGITVDGGPELGVTPDGSYLAVTLLSAPLSDLLRHMDKESDNFFAEMLVKDLGHDFRGVGSTEAGLRVMRASLDALGVPRDGYRIYDGSGLSYSDRVTARSVSKLLRLMPARQDFPTFFDSLSIAGVDGTLEHRMRGTAAFDNFRGKTGTLNISSCLSGYVSSSTGHRLIVSMLMNGHPVNVWAAHQAQDAIAAALARSGL